MSSVPATSGSGSGSAAGSSSSSSSNSLNNVDISQFLQLMITQLENQDPLNPTSNSDLMQQIGEIQQLSSNNKLSTTLNNLATGQNISNATGLMGKHITGLDDSGNSVDGTVSQVSVVDNATKLYVGNQIVSLNNIQSVFSS